MALNPLLSLIGRLVARSGRKRGNRQTDRQNDRTTTITLAAHARRGLIIITLYISCTVHPSLDIVGNIVLKVPSDGSRAIAHLPISL